ncbi:metallophosphoesterase family protein [Paenibacillus sp. IB182496]|uniref:Metallophosphoesterase family protein n=2 Tax=Paenibacillus sabuli TaxID=2772509 RepID=A0A927BSN7_9BACL|nr:metallophosphoesterase family protein [Paenibacillus sabuli]
MHAQAREYGVITEEATVRLLPRAFDGTRIFFITDLHRRAIPDGLIAQCLEAGGADLVIIGGDLAEKGVPLARTRANIHKLRRIAPIYAIYGNHDTVCDQRALEVMLREEGVHVLVNSNVLLEQGGERVLLCGIDDSIHDRDRLDLALDGTLAGIAESEEGRRSVCKILLAHDPLIAAQLSGMEADLILSGHTHGGQMRLPLYGPLLRTRSVRLYRSGWFEIGARQKAAGEAAARLLVSNGFGTSKVPLRLFVPPQTHLLTLRCPTPDRSGQS